MKVHPCCALGGEVLRCSFDAFSSLSQETKPARENCVAENTNTEILGTAHATDHEGFDFDESVPLTVNYETAISTRYDEQRTPPPLLASPITLPWNSASIPHQCSAHSLLAVAASHFHEFREREIP